MLDGNLTFISIISLTFRNLLRWWWHLNRSLRIGSSSVKRDFVRERKRFAGGDNTTVYLLNSFIFQNFELVASLLLWKAGLDSKLTTYQRRGLNVDADRVIADKASILTVRCGLQIRLLDHRVQGIKGLLIRIGINCTLVCINLRSVLVIHHCLV